jgi:hypothetical protein
MKFDIFLPRLYADVILSRDGKVRQTARGLTSSSDVLTVTTGTFEWSNSEKEKFAQQVGELVGSDGFVTELSDKIGKPLPGESEDEFVERAKNAMKKLLSAKLSGKN